MPIMLTLIELLSFEMKYEVSSIYPKGGMEKMPIPYLETQFLALLNLLSHYIMKLSLMLSQTRMEA